MKQAVIICVALACALLAGCAMGPSYPEPQPDSGQLLIELMGQPREGVGGPVTYTDVQHYALVKRSIEQGRAYERVEYDALEDVVVVLQRADGKPSQPNPWGDSGMYSEDVGVNITAGEDGFNCVQELGIALAVDFKLLRVENKRSAALDLYFISDKGDVLTLNVPADDSATIELSAGTYEVECDQDEALTCTIYILHQQAGWIGNSRDGAFFDFLAPGKYEIMVYPPRLPSWSASADVEAGRRATVTAPLSVNQLPRLDR